MKSSVFLLLLAIVVALPTMADGSWWGLGKIVCKWYGTSVTADDAQMDPTVFDFVGDPVPKRPVHDLAVYEFIHKDVNRVMPTNQPIVVVADVMSVTMVAVTGLDDKCRSLSGSKSLAWYRVTVHVRRVERGELMNRWLSFPVSQDGVWDLKLQGGWLFYRGITLKLGLSQKDGGLILDYAVPTLPYPPYSTEGIQVYGGSRGNMPETNAFTRCEGVRRVLDTDDTPLAIQYGDHTLAVFVRGVPLFSECVARDAQKYYDFGVSAKVHVWFNGSGGDEAYWRNAWFADHWNDTCSQLPSALTLHRIGEAETDGKGTNTPDSSTVVIGEQKEVGE